MDNQTFFQFSRHSKVRIIASLIIHVIDSYTGGPPIHSGLSITIDGVFKQPIVKPDGYYIFTNLPAGMYRIIIRSSNYLPLEKVFVVNHSEQIHNIILYPSKFYSLQSNAAATVRFCLRNNRNEPICNKKVYLTVLNPRCAIAKLAIDHLKLGEDIVTVSKLSEVFIGDTLLLIDRSNKKSEYCEIAEQFADLVTYRLRNRVSQDYYRSSLFLPVICSYTDEKGEVLLLIRHFPEKQLNMKLEIELDGQPFEQEFVLDINERKNLGVIKVS